MTISKGTKLVTLTGETCNDANDEEVQAAPGTEGVVTKVSERPSGKIYEADFGEGVWVFLTEAEINDPRLYQVEGNDPEGPRPGM